MLDLRGLHAGLAWGGCGVDGQETVAAAVWSLPCDTVLCRCQSASALVAGLAREARLL